MKEVALQRWLVKLTSQINLFFSLDCAINYHINIQERSNSYKWIPMNIIPNKKKEVAKLLYKFCMVWNIMFLDLHVAWKRS